MDIRPQTMNRHELLKVSNEKISRARKLRRTGELGAKLRHRGAVKEE